MKTAIHLPLQTANALLYLIRSDGGFGVMSLLAQIPDIFLGRLIRLGTLENPHIQAVLGTNSVAAFRSRLEHPIRPYGSGGQQFIYWHHRLP